MVFSSPTFLFAFLPTVLLANWIVPAGWRRYLLIAASAVFYWWGVQDFLLIVWASTLVDWGVGLGIKHYREEGPGVVKALLVIGVLQSLGLLFYFKYAGFATQQLQDLFGASVISVALPIGISFFAFEKISYVVDVYRGDVEPRRDPLDLLLFVSLFPRSIAGPIVRLREIQDDLRRPDPTVEDVREGAIRFMHGLVKKVLIADQIGPIADATFHAAPEGDLSSTAAWLGILAYTMQLYFDFSGYSDMAIGIARMLGFKLPENFRRPYSSVSITDFWRRWHMTLSRWFRDYVYIPLGGSRGSAARTSFNLLVVFVLVGFWHGAEWTFLLFGLWHGTWLMTERQFGWRAVDGPVRGVALRRAATFLIVMLGWVAFRSGSLSVLADYLDAMFSFTSGMDRNISDELTRQAITVLCLASLVVVLPGRIAGGRWLAEASGRRPELARWVELGVAAPLALAFAMAGTFSPFLYFHF